MSKFDKNTWPTIVHFDVLHGPFTSEELWKRTLRLVVIDNYRRYDELEWELDNRDGLLTRPEFLAVGLFLRVRWGYEANTSRWRSFIITRAKGGVGVSPGGGTSRAVGYNEGVVTFYGRNRNAPDLRKSRRKGKPEDSIKPTGRGPRYGPRRGRPTTDVTSSEDFVRRDPHFQDIADQPRNFRVRRLSDAAIEIARRIGYNESQIYVEPTGDNREAVTLPAGMHWGDWLQAQANALHWVFKAKDDTFKFHSDGWTGSDSDVKDVYYYGGSPQGVHDVLSLQLDFDFELPTPGSIKGHSYIPTTRNAEVVEVGSQPTALQLTKSERVEAPNDQVRLQTLGGSESLYLPGGTTKLATTKTIAKMLRRQVRAMKLILEITGEPQREGGDLVGVDRTGSPYVDRNWRVEIARHELTHKDYVTTLTLGVPTSTRTGKGIPITYNSEGLEVGGQPFGLQITSRTPIIQESLVRANRGKR